MTNNWSQSVTTRPPATFPPPGMYNRPALEIYMTMRRPDISPNGLASAIGMNAFFIARAGSKINPRMKASIKKANRLLRAELDLLKLGASISYPGELLVVHPPPPKHFRVGGRNGHNHRASEYYFPIGLGQLPWWTRHASLACSAHQVPVDSKCEMCYPVPT